MKLRWLILIAFIGVTLIPVAFLGVWPQSKALQNEVDRVSDQHLLLARHLGLDMERYYRDAVAAFDILVNAAIAGRPLTDAGRLMENLSFAHICVARLSDGKVLSSVGPTDIPCPQVIPEVRLTLFKALAKEGQVVLSGVLANRAGEPTIYMLQQRGELLAADALNTVYLQELGRDIAFGEHGHAAIVDAKGLVIAHPREDWVKARKDISQVPPVAHMIAGNSGISQFYSPALDQDMIAGFTSVAGPGWGIMIPQPFSELEAKADSVRLFALTVITAGFLVALVVAWVFTGYLTRPIAAMGDAARRLAEGESDARAEIGGGSAPLELRSLLERFNAMADTIQRSQEALEERVQERTRELRQSEQELRQAQEQLELGIEERTRDLRESEARFRDFAEAAADWFWETDADLRFTYMSENVERIVGVPPEWHYGKTRENLLSEDYDREAWQAHLDDLRARRPFRNFEYERVGTDIETRWLRTNGIPIFDQEGVFLGYRGTGSDVTEQKLAEQKLRASEAQLRQAQKMEAVGQLTGGVAHDFNNLLAVIKGNAELLTIQSQREDPLIQAIMRASNRGAELTQRLLAFSRRQSLRAEAIDLADVVFKMSDILSRTLGAEIEIETKIEPNLKPAFADPSQVETALLNLAINARDAMPGGGRVIIHCAMATLDAQALSDNPHAVSGDFLLLAVTDSGEGMTAEVREHAIEPFFTTKEVGVGSGLGLSMVYGFAQQSGGDLTIDSEAGRGTTVKLYLPAAATAMPEPETASPEDAVPQGHGEKILLVEDNEDVRSLVHGQLVGLGYDVIDAADAAAARAIVANTPSPFDLILSDVMLPGGTSGPALVETLRASRPDLKVVFMSGYPTETDRFEDYMKRGDPLLNKPFRRAELARVLRQVLG